ncbi:MAG: glycosyltransferase [Pseudomonadota bacterium]
MADTRESAADVSVVVPAREAADTLAGTLASIAPEREVGEILVVVAESRDATRTIAEAAAAEDARIRVLDNPGGAIVPGLNIGWAAATGRYTAKIDADDLVRPGRFARQRTHLEAHPDHVAVTGGYDTISYQGAVVAEIGLEMAEGAVNDRLDGRQRAFTHFGAWLVRLETIRAIGGARPFFVTAEDMDLIFRLAEAGTVWHQPAAAYAYRLRDGSITHSAPGSRTSFFHQCAIDFAADRRSRGSDALIDGRPPEPPAHDAAEAPLVRADTQAAGYLESEAWRHLGLGQRRRAWGQMVASLRLAPLDRSKWRSAAAMALRSLRR